MLQASELQFQYAPSAAFSFPPISLALGEKALITGNSGCGKTTWLSLLAGMITPRQGTITINNTAINQLTAKALDQFRANTIGMVFQKPHFISGLSALQNVTLAATWTLSNPENAPLLFEKVGLSHRLHANIQELSLGELQRLSVARALLHQPKLLIADEPTSSLDDKNAEDVIQLLEAVCEQSQCALLVVSHDARLHNRFQHKIQL